MPHYNRNDTFTAYKKNRDSRLVADIEIYRLAGKWQAVILPRKSKEIAGQIEVSHLPDSPAGEEHIQALAVLLLGRLGYRWGLARRMDTFE